MCHLSTLRANLVYFHRITVFTELIQWPSGGTDELNLKVVDAELPPGSRITELLFLSFAGGAVSSL